MRWLVLALVVAACGGRAERDEAKTETDGGSVAWDPPAPSFDGGIFLETPDAAVEADVAVLLPSLPPPDAEEPSNESEVWFTLTKPPGSGCRESGEFLRSAALPPTGLLSSSCKVSAASFYGRMTQAETDFTSAELIEIEGNERSARLRLRIRSLPLAQDDCTISEFQRGADWFSAKFECLRLDEPSLPNRCAASGEVRFVGCEVVGGDQ